jgi:hypothetical protein
MSKHVPFNMFSVDGNEALQYSMFMKLYGTREKVNDVTSPRYTPIGDIMLPRNALIHYQQQAPGEVGPSNTAPFISNFDKRINIFFDLNYEVILGATKTVNVAINSVIKNYEGSHFIYSRTRNLTAVINKEAELFVNNLAIAQIPIVYKNRTVFSPFQISYNGMYTLMDAVNRYSKYGRHQFIEIPLPRTFPTYNNLKIMFERYKKFFNEDGSIVKYDRQTLVPFQAEQSFWLLDLFGILMGYDEKKYSLFNRLNDDSRRQLEIIFTYNGKCWIVNLQNIINLLSYSDKPTDTSPGTARVNYFKRFYLGLINLVTPISETIVEATPEDFEENEEEDNDNSPEVKQSGKNRTDDDSNEETKELSKPPSSLGDNSRSDPLADLYASTKRVDPVQDNTSGDTPAASNPPALDYGADVGSDEDENTESEESWGKDIDDEVFERVTVESAAITKATKYSPTASIERELNSLAGSGQITSKEMEYYLNAANRYKDIEIGGRTLEEIIDIRPENMVLKNVPLSPDSLSVRDKSVQQSRTEELGSEYVRTLLERNMIEMMVHVQNGQTSLVGLDREETVTADSKYIVYTLQLQGIKGNRSTRRIRVPLVESDNTFTINGVKMYAQLMRMELPIRKISPTKVSLTSYYDKKVMVERSTMKADDFAVWLRKSIIEKSYLDKSIQVSLGGYKPPKEKVCYYYSILASRFKSIITPEFEFDFDTVKLVGDDKALARLCNEESWLIGFSEDKPILIDSSGLVSVDGENKGYLEEILGINIAKAPVPMATININGYKFPAVVVLSYWVGFNNLMNMLKVEYRSLDPNTRPNLSADEYVVSFADERLVFNRRDELATLIMAGLRKLPSLNNFSRSNLDDPNVWFSLIGDPRVKPSHFKEMSLIYDMFIDPITKRLLEKGKYPTIMDGLVIEAVKMMLNNESKSEIEISEQRFVGYERFAGHIYREMVLSTRQYRNKPNNGKKTFDLNPEAVMMKIITDSSCQAIEEVNPIHQLKSQEEYTFGGTLGRSDRAMVRRTRGQLPNSAGILSEAGKDSGKVGFIGYLTSDAKITDLYGNVDVNAKGTNAGRGSVTMNTLYGGTKDDSKRSMFSTVQQSQVMAADNYAVNPLRTSYDSIVAYRTSELYSSVSKKAGKIIEVSQYGIWVEYEDGTTDKFPLGYEIGKGAGEYHKHMKVTDRAVGYEFKKGEILAWDELFFGRDNIDPTRVAWKSGSIARIALIEDQFTFEDSLGITKEFADASTSPFLKPNTFSVEGNQAIKIHVKVGDSVEYDQILCDIQNPESAVFDFEDAGEFSGMDRLGIKQIKAKQSGVITKIEVLYNGDPEDWDDSLKTFINKQNGIRAKSASYKELAAKTGDVGGNTSIGKSKLYPDTAVISIYIDNKIVTTTADKFVVGNQMKGTVGFIYEEPIYTVDGRKVDITFSTKSLLNRMVLSLRDKLAANETNSVRTSQLKQKYGRYD